MYRDFLNCSLDSENVMPTSIHPLSLYFVVDAVCAIMSINLVVVVVVVVYRDCHDASRNDC